MKPSESASLPQYTTPAPPFYDATGLHITRYADIERIIQLERSGRFSSDLSFLRRAAAKVGLEIPEQVLSIFHFPWAAGTVKADGSPGAHGLLSGILKGCLTREKIDSLEPVIWDYARRVLRNNIVICQENGTEGTIDFAGFADKLAYRAISVLAGFPTFPQDEQFMMQHLRDISGRKDFLDTFRPESPELRRYIHSVIKHNKDTNNLVDKVAAARAHGHITEDQMFGLLLGTWAAGRETSATLICMTLGLLDEIDWHWEVIARRRKKDAPWRQQVIGEALRFSPFQSSPRVSVGDIDFADALKIPDATLVHLHWEAANRDTSVFGDDANIFRPGRSARKGHLGFGHGLHYCLGASLGVLTTDIAMRAVYETFGPFKITQWERRPGFVNTVRHAMATYDQTRAISKLAGVYGEE